MNTKPITTTKPAQPPATAPLQAGTHNPASTPSNPGDPSQAIKAAGATDADVEAAKSGVGTNAAPEQPPTLTGPKASDIPAEHIRGGVGAGLPIGTQGGLPDSGPVTSASGAAGAQQEVFEWTLSQQSLNSLVAQHFGFDPNVGVLQVVPEQGGLKVRYQK